MRFKQTYYLTEMPHFQIGQDQYDLFVEKSPNVFPQLINILRKYKEEQVKKLFDVNKFFILQVKSQFKKQPENIKNEIRGKMKNNGMAYILSYLEN